MLKGKRLKQKKRTSPSNFTYSVQIRDQIPASTDSFDFFEPNYFKKVLSNLKRKKEKKQTNKQNHHPVLHIQISVNSKFQLQQTI